MPQFRRRDRATAVASTKSPRAFAITGEDLQALERVAGHARMQLTKLSDSNAQTIDDSSAYWLVLTLSERAGAARVLGHSGIPMLVDEVGHVQAAVLNLESYQGDPLMVLKGYELLNRVTLLAQLPRVADEIHGVVTLPDEAPATN